MSRSSLIIRMAIPEPAAVPPETVAVPPETQVASMVRAPTAREAPRAETAAASMVMCVPATPVRMVQERMSPRISATIAPTRGSTSAWTRRHRRPTSSS